MGLELVTQDPRQYVFDLLSSGPERVRRRGACERTDMLRDDFYTIIKMMISDVFREGTVRNALNELAPLIGASNFFKRICDEKARPVYAMAPTRRVFTDEKDLNEDTDAISPEQEAWNALEKEMHYNAKLDLVARLLEAHNDLVVLPRYLKRQKKMTLTILTPDMYSIVPDPEDKTCGLAIFYDTERDEYGATVSFVGFDDTNIYNGNITNGTFSAKPHDYGRIPAIQIHRRARWGCYFDSTTGSDALNAAKTLMLYDLIIMKKIRAQSHLQLAYEGDLENLVKGQITDEHSILVAQGNSKGKGFHLLDLQSDPTKIIAAKNDTMEVCAANHGISLDRLNQRAIDISEESGLKERVMELAGVMSCVETELFEEVKLIANAEHPKYKLPEESKLNVDFGPFLARVERKTQLENRQTERSMGLRSGVDDVLEDNPELRGNRAKAMEFIDQKMKEEAVIVEQRRALNIPADYTSDQPGSSAEENGAMGPKVRDGEISRDEAADSATGGDRDAAGSNRRK